MLEELLQVLGLTKNEVAVYLEAYKLGKTTPARIAKGTGIVRPTVYAVIKTLIEKRLLIEDYGGKSTYIIAQPPEALGKSLERERQTLKKKEEVVKKVLEEFSSLPHNTRYSIPTIRFVEEENIYDFLCKNSPKWIESCVQLADKKWWGFRDHTFTESYHEWMTKLWEQEARRHAGFAINILVNPLHLSKTEKLIDERNYPGRILRPWKGGVPFTASFWIAGEYIMMAVTNERPHYLIEIKNNVLAENLREVFRNIWKDATNEKLKKS